MSDSGVVDPSGTVAIQAGSDLDKGAPGLIFSCLIALSSIVVDKRIGNEKLNRQSGFPKSLITSHMGV